MVWLFARNRCAVCNWFSLNSPFLSLSVFSFSGSIYLFICQLPTRIIFYNDELMVMKSRRKHSTSISYLFGAKAFTHHNGWSSIKFTTFNQCLLIEIFVLEAKVCHSCFYRAYLNSKILFCWLPFHVIREMNQEREKKIGWKEENEHRAFDVRYDANDRISTPSLMSFPKIYSFQVPTLDDL